MKLSDLIEFSKTLIIFAPVAFVIAAHLALLYTQGSSKAKKNVDVFVKTVPALLIMVGILITVLFVTTPIALLIAARIDALPVEASAVDSSRYLVTKEALLEVRIWGAFAVSIYAALGIVNILIPVMLKKVAHATLLSVLAVVLLTIGAAGGNIFNLLAAENAWDNQLTAWGLLAFIYAGLSIFALLLYTLILNWKQRRLVESPAEATSATAEAGASSS